MSSISSNVIPMINGNYYTYIFDNPNPDEPGNYITFDQTYDVSYLIVGGGGSGNSLGSSGGAGGAGGSYAFGNTTVTQNTYNIIVGTGGSSSNGGSSSFNNIISNGGQTGVNLDAGTQGGAWNAPDSTVYYFSGGGGCGGSRASIGNGGDGGGGAYSSGTDSSGNIGGNGGGGGGGIGGNGGTGNSNGFPGGNGSSGYSGSSNSGGIGGPGGIRPPINNVSGGGGGGGGGGFGGGGGGRGGGLSGPGGNGANGVVILSFIYEKQTPTITDFPNLYKTILDETFTLTEPTSNSNGAFTYTSSNNNVATVSGNVVSVLKKGNTTITATQEESVYFLSGSIDASLIILNNICFPAGTPITCDQGNIPIEKIDIKNHTIRGKKILAITQTITTDKFLVCFEKDSLGENIPSQKTFISRKHKVFYKGKMLEAQEFIGKFDTVYRLKYTGEILYNVLMEKYDKMMVNNLICETLHPENIVARLYTGNYSPSEFNEIVFNMNECVKKQDRKKFLAICNTLK